MSKLPLMSGDKLVRYLIKLGFLIVRQKGSHVILKHTDGRITVVPCHKGQDIQIGLMRKILKDIRITPEEFYKNL